MINTEILRNSRKNYFVYTIFLRFNLFSCEKTHLAKTNILYKNNNKPRYRYIDYKKIIQ